MPRGYAFAIDSEATRPQVAAQLRLSDARKARKKRRRWIIGIGLGLLLFAGLCFVWLRPAAFFDVDGSALQSSLARETGGSTWAGTHPCEEKANDVWRCGILDAGGSEGVGYRLTTHGLGCWDATRLGTGSTEGGTPKQASGCVDMSDISG